MEEKNQDIKESKNGLQFISNGNGTCYITKIGANAGTEVEIPDIYDGESVTGIGELAFYKCENLKSIVIPDGVKSIGNSAFQGCSNLVKIEIPESVTSIGELAFFNCTALKEIRFIGTEEQWNGVTKGENWNLLASVKMTFAPAKKKKIIGSKNIPVRHETPEIAQEKKQTKLPVVFGVLLAVILVIGGGLYIMPGMFFANKHLHEYTTIITEPTCTDKGFTTYICECGVSYTDDYKASSEHKPGEWETVKEATKTENGLKVQNCSVCGLKIEENLIPATGSIGLQFAANADGTYMVKGIGTCTDSDIVIPATYNGKSVTRIGKEAFWNCSGLKSIVIPDSVTFIGEAAFAASKNLKSVTIGKGVTHISDYAFDSCSALQSIVIPDGVKSLGSQMFFMCFSLTSVTLPDGLLSIGFAAFEWCYNLQSIVLPESLTEIGSSAFEGCSSLTSLRIPKNVTRIESAFSDCTVLKSFSVDENNPNYCSVDGVLFNKNKTELICCPSGKIGSYTIPKGVTSIAERAFSGCRELTHIIISDTVTSIGSRAFYACKGLEIITIPDSVKTIQSFAFSCANLTSVVIGKGVTNIGKKAFEYCTYLNQIRFEGTKEEWNTISKSEDWNYDVPATEVICSDGSVSIK